MVIRSRRSTRTLERLWRPRVEGVLPALGLLVLLGTACQRPESTAPSPPTAIEPTTSVVTDTAVAAPWFVDAAAVSGLDFVHFNGMTGKFYFSEVMGAGAALFDYDNDGDLDAFLVQGQLLGTSSVSEALFSPDRPLPLSDRLYRNDLERGEDGKSRPRFVDVTAESGLHAVGYGMGVAAADFDNDGFVDLYLTNFGPNQLWRNNGDGTFSDVTATSGGSEPRWSVPAAVVDFDRDGWLDLYVGNYVDYSVAANKACSDELGAANYCGPLAFAPAPDTLLHNRGAAAGDRLVFEDWSLRAGIGAEYGGALGAVAADWNDDGWPDIYVGNDGMPNQLWINLGDGSFENQAVLAGCAVSGLGRPQASMGISTADFDGDGDEDLFISHLQQETNTIYVNDGQALFEDRSAETGLGAPSWDMTGFGTAWFDYDNDGWLDQLTVNGAVKVIKSLALAGDRYPLHQKNQLFHNRGDGTFEDVSARAGEVFALSEVSRGAAFGDVDNDGDIDVLISNNSGPARLLLNQLGQDAPWLGLRLVGVAGSRDMLGAWVGVERGGAPSLWRRVTVTASYASSSDPRLVFGLAGGQDIERIWVRWPDGRTGAWNGDAVALGQYNTLRQGDGRSDS